MAGRLSRRQADRWTTAFAVACALLLLLYAASARGEEECRAGPRWEVDLSGVQGDRAVAACVGPVLCVFARSSGSRLAPEVVTMSCTRPPAGTCPPPSPGPRLNAPAGRR